jgi:hypothetical protein
MLLALALWIQATPFFTYVREGPSYAYPVILSLHMAGIALFGGMILMTDMRILGWAMTSHSVSEVIDQLRVPKRLGFILAATCGILLFCCKAEEYYYNVFFRIKLTLFALVAVHALVFRGSVYNQPAEIDRAPRVLARAKLAASLSLLLWLGIACAGRGIGYIEIPFGLHARRFHPVNITCAAHMNVHVPRPFGHPARERLEEIWRVFCCSSF